MKINADFSKRVVVKFDENDWVPSPMPGVERKMLDRIGEEVARATTIVRYAPGSAFSAHTHDGGEEYLVLDGVFVDEHGDFPKGTYVRNPPTSSHTPSAPQGATILVKLHQFDPADRTQLRVDTTTGGTVQPLFTDPREDVRVETWGPGADVTLDAAGGMEVFVIDGGFAEGGDTLGAWDWLRLPVGTATTAKAGPEGARVWVKSGHLTHVTEPA
ncbi:MAG: cupin domain-containing protein [Rhodobacter sp.]|nr:cupin domain-containing protein [Rhodobacter sp.]